MSTLSGLDILARDEFAKLHGRSIGLVCNMASIAGDLRHILELTLPLHQVGKLHLEAVFGPQHGLWGHTQDNMIEWEGERDPGSNLTIYSLYGEHREPTEEMLRGVELMVIDLPDVGARYYTFIWTMALCMKACQERGIPVLVLDRPNPTNGLQVEGTVLDPTYTSFVGLYPLPTRHGLTIGEVATYLRTRFFPGCALEIVRIEGWRRESYFENTEQPWAMPSPNMPTVDTAVVYPGMCLFEATLLSEGRGTTRPFEIFGAPFIDGWKLSARLNALGLPGVHFRSIQFEPTFNKHAKQLCEGAFIHVLDRRSYESVLTAVAILQEIRRLYGDKLCWHPGPYEYEYEKKPIDILAGNDWLRQGIDDLTPLAELRERMSAECDAFAPTRDASLLY